MLTRTLLSLVAVAAALPAQTGERSKSPSVVLVLVDDLGWMDLSCQGSTFYQTPNIDRLAREGMRFRQAYAGCAVCSPTRAAVMTGRSPARTGVTDWIRARFQRGGLGTPKANPSDYVGGKNRKLLCPPNPYWMEHSERTIAELLQAGGYTTGYIGKWHLGDPAWFPKTQGFMENFGGCDYGQPPSYFDPYKNKRLPQGIPTLKPRKAGEYLTDREGDEAVAFIRRHRMKSFFLCYAPYAVHTPIQAKEELRESYAKRRKKGQRQNNAKYAAMIHSLDEAVGKICDELRRLHLEDNTMVIFTSDNGGLRGPTHNGPLRSGKGFPYEGGLRVPFIAWWPDVIQAGLVSDTPVTSVDLLPTILDIADLDSPENVALDGVSLASHLRSMKLAPVKRKALYWHFPHYRGRKVTPYSVIREGDWKLIKRYEGPTFELFNLAKDPGEASDVASANTERVKDLDRKLMAHLKNVGAKLPRPREAK